MPLTNKKTLAYLKRLHEHNKYFPKSIMLLIAMFHNARIPAQINPELFGSPQHPHARHKSEFTRAPKTRRKKARRRVARAKRLLREDHRDRKANFKYGA